MIDRRVKAVTNEQEWKGIIALAQQHGVYIPEPHDRAHTHIICRGSQGIAAFATWQVVCDEATLLAIAVDTMCRRQGLGRALLTYGEQHWQTQGVDYFFLEVRASNEAAQRLYAQQGYQIIAERKEYYPIEGGKDGRESALVYKKTI